MNISSHAMVSNSDAVVQQVGGHGIQSRQEDYVGAAMAKAVELRALHATLLQGISSSSSPLCRPPNQAASSSQDYPVFAPTYEEQQLPGYHYAVPEDHSVSGKSGNWSRRLERETKADEIDVPDTETSDIFLTNRRSCTNAPGANIVRTSSTQTSSVCTPAAIIVVDSDQKKAKDKGAKFSWLFPKSKKKKPQSAMSLTTLGSEDMSRILKDWGALSMETLRKELLEANESRDAALSEVAEARSSLGELREKLESLESYCEMLRKALKQAQAQAQGRDSTSRRIATECSMPVSEEVMVEGFLQIVSEARLSVKKFCKTLIDQSEDADNHLTEKLNKLLQPHRLSLGNKHPKGVLYHLEALMNQSLYQDFENCVFEKSGCPKVLDPEQDRLESFASFVTLRRLSWDEVLRKGTKSYSDEFSRFCDRKMGGIVSALDWLRPWPEQLLQSFFVAAKCVWLLHLLAFSFSPHLAILRVEEDRSFDPVYMEEIPLERKKARAPEQQKVKIMVMPGFYVRERVLRCRVLCRCRSVT